MKNIPDKEGKSSLKTKQKLRTVGQRPNNECKGEGEGLGNWGWMSEMNKKVLPHE